MYQYELDFTRTATVKHSVPPPQADAPWNEVTDLHSAPQQLEFEFSYHVTTEKTSR